MLKQNAFGVWRRAIGFVGLSVIAIMFTTEAQAAYPCATGYKLISGYCLKTGSVTCQVGVDKLGNVSTNPKTLNCQIDRDSNQTKTGLLFCGNPGGQQPTAQVLVVWPESSPGVPRSLSVSTLIDSAANIGGGGIVVDDNGFLPEAQFSADVNVNQQILNEMAQANCPNNNYTGFDFVPCDFATTLKVIDNKTGKTEFAKNNCTLNTPTSSCSTLKWNDKTNSVEDRTYSCFNPTTGTTQ